VAQTGQRCFNPRPFPMRRAMLFAELVCCFQQFVQFRQFRRFKLQRVSFAALQAVERNTSVVNPCIFRCFSLVKEVAVDSRIWILLVLHKHRNEDKARQFSFAQDNLIYFLTQSSNPVAFIFHCLGH
jgi:hypothetical protein